ncbi:efflux RND transporter permease subunit [Reinekea sp. G2M2-21]|uniref:efflux RND transporter permease subunit n=1 Tax=Reinekea sp. G2M2-21 TaxID=2788942 RepID=UPI0018AA21E7|nr:efflux RND transporter permease subunit [Reinekea sp. G2M2-21]
MFITKVSINNPVFATMVMAAIMVFGLFSYQKLSVESLPDVDFPVVVVVVSYPGASPEAVESEILKPIENSVNTLSGLDSIQATAVPSRAMVVMMFDLDVDSTVAAQDVRDKMAQLKGFLPSGAEEPYILRFDPGAMPIVSLAVSAQDMAPRELTTLVDNVIIKELSIIPGVGSATVIGGVSRQLNIEVDPDKLVAYGISLSQVTQALRQTNQNFPAGDLTGALNIQTLQIDGEVIDPDEFMDVIVAYQQGQPVYLRDIATLNDGIGAVDSAAMLHGERALAIDIVKIQGANTVEVAESVHKKISELMEQLPPGVVIDVVQDNSIEVKNSFESVMNMLIEGALLTVVIVFLFLNSWRSTVITGLTLPISIIGTMMVLLALGFTLNMMTLMALSLAVGLLIDDAIVVRENIMRHLHMGKGHRQAAEDGTNEIGLAVLATTLSIVAVFLPVAFMDGILGQFFLQFGVTVSVAVLISLFVAFTLDPMMSSVWYDPSADPRVKKGWFSQFIQHFDDFFEALGVRYTTLLQWALKHRKSTLLMAFAILVGSLTLIPKIGGEFVPVVDTSLFQVDMQGPDDASIEYTSMKVKQVHDLVSQYSEVKGTYATINSGATSAGKNAATILVQLIPPTERARSAVNMADMVREALVAIPGVEFKVGAANGFGGVASPIMVNLYGDDFDTLDRLSQQLVARLEQIEGLADVESNFEGAQPILGVKVNSDAANDLGISLAHIGSTLRTMVNGETVTEWTDRTGDTFDVAVRLQGDARDNIETLKKLPITLSGMTGTQGMVNLEQVATINASTGPAQVNRMNLSRQVVISANLDGANLLEINPKVQAVLDELPLPSGYRVQFGGDTEQLVETAIAAASALLLAIICIYLVLASQFGSFLQPIAIMMSLPMALVGVLLGLLVGGSTLNMYSIIGFIMLMGLVVKNAILLVDNANQQRKAGFHLYEALVMAGRIRFRPIVMTTMAMIFGMLPMALNLHGGSGQNAPMAHAVIGGLISSTLLTLVVVPVALTYIDSIGAFFGRLLTSQKPAEEH